MLDVLPTGFIGLMLAAFAAAYMSTVSSQLNWGTSYLINDFYRRFVRKDGDERLYILASRIATAILVVIAGAVSLRLESIRETWQLMLGIGAGTGLVYILRWYWWRINAWSEISAMATAMITSLVLWFGKSFFTEKVFGLDPASPQSGDLYFAYSLLATVAVTTIVWLAVTFMTRPEPDEKLIAFYRKVRPGGPGWKRVAQAAGESEGESLAPAFANWFLGCALVYSSLFSIGQFVLGEIMKGILLSVVAVAAGALISWNLGRANWREAALAEK